jgi:Ca2+-dependent lipid-binding protein
MSAQQHHLHEPYSSRNPVPNVPRFLAEQAKKIDPTKDKKDNTKTKREVRDPITKNEVVIQDVDANYAKAVQDPHVIKTFDVSSDNRSQFQMRTLLVTESKKCQREMGLLLSPR